MDKSEFSDLSIFNQKFFLIYIDISAKSLFPRKLNLIYIILFVNQYNSSILSRITDSVSHKVGLDFIHAVHCPYFCASHANRCIEQLAKPADLPFARSLAPTYLPVYLFDLIQLDLLRLLATLISLY